MITRYLLTIKHNTLHRGFCTSRPSSNIFEKVKHFLLAEERENFDSDNIRKAHKKDGVDEEKWTLIYRDIGASRTFYMTAAFLPCFIIGSAVFVVDINTNSPSNRFDFVQKLVNDAEELGSLVVLPSVALALVIVFLARVQQLRLIRIYQNKTNTEEFMAIRSKYMITQFKETFRRDETTGFYFAEDQTDGARVALHFLFGNIQIGNRKFMIMDDMFRANNYRSYMLNETSVPPRL
ncbi:hypothetical protein GCK72_018144 [Caenorhabditis remanei]|uniref:Uncharacterized protein n=1 Tax=Caenorhabditis remanei TaxID=31234 RepID=A0A6A5G9A7_CAERE|nr:hypothetical protein GCK72_018144 [Caenorhabditis remanei]KAF1751590.1 hypothetical protein GCK72_018144 [Caenorhabditis remanei]